MIKHREKCQISLEISCEILSRNWQSYSYPSVLLHLFDLWPINVFIGMDLSGCGKCSRVSTMKERSGNNGLDVHSSEYFTSSGIR
jgi:hypothetical protein